MAARVGHSLENYVLPDRQDPVDATPRLVEIAEAFASAQLAVIFIGNAGIARQGAASGSGSCRTRRRRSVAAVFVQTSAGDTRSRRVWGGGTTR
jgi:hypothetical protein